VCLLQRECVCVYCSTSVCVFITVWATYLLHTPCTPEGIRRSVNRRAFLSMGSTAMCLVAAAALMCATVFAQKVALRIYPRARCTLQGA
jgi:hypothetical protein